jgi:hypothetical protein
MSSTTLTLSPLSAVSRSFSSTGVISSGGSLFFLRSCKQSDTLFRCQFSANESINDFLLPYLILYAKEVTHRSTKVQTQWLHVQDRLRTKANLSLCAQVEHCLFVFEESRTDTRGWVYYHLVDRFLCTNATNEMCE